MSLCIDPIKCEFNDFRKTGVHFCALAKCRYSNEEIIARLKRKIDCYSMADWANENPRLKKLVAKKKKLEGKSPGENEP